MKELSARCCALIVHWMYVVVELLSVDVFHLVLVCRRLGLSSCLFAGVPLLNVVDRLRQWST